MRQVQDLLSRQPGLLDPLRRLSDPMEIARQLARIAGANGIATTEEEIKRRIDNALARDLLNREMACPSPRSPSPPAAPDGVSAPLSPTEGESR
ncbi:hypothetical protein [Azospirillum thermophilum]|uniref:hypothetical protein n=1 Tax=Azospirillum thermophilum TaxID=2202148 RepID=UPI0011B5AD7C|nr:hypothetical protein [Azospirillum thermophilum]